MSFIRFDTLWLCHLGQAGQAKPAENRVSYLCVQRPTYFCICKMYLNLYSFLYQCSVFTSLCLYFKSGRWRKSPLLRCWKLAQASIADFSRPQNWIYWLTLSAVSFENRLMIGTMCFSSQRRKVRG